VARRDDHRLDREGRRRAQDRADIVRISDVVEDEHQAARREVVDVGGGEGSASANMPW